MKPFILFLTVFIMVAMFACKTNDDMSEFEISNLGFSKEDANRSLSHKPTGNVDVQVGGQLVKINFGLDDFIKEDINADLEYYYDDKSIKGDLFKTFSSVGKLADYYKRSQFEFTYGYSNYRLAPYMDGNIVYSKIEYALAQECFKDECQSMTRKSILQMVVDKHEKKEWLLSNSTMRTGLFLMAIILLTENDSAFVDAIFENPDLENVLSMNLDKQVQDVLYSHIESGLKIDEFTYQSAVKFLSHNIE